MSSSLLQAAHRGRGRGRNKENQPWESVAEDPEDRRSTNLTSANVFDWWMLLESQTSCSFCLSRDRVSCTNFRDARTEEEEIGIE